MVTGLVNGIWQFSTPTESIPLNRSPEFVTGHYIGDPCGYVAMPNLVKIRPWGLLGKWVKYNNFCLFIYTFLLPFCLQCFDAVGWAAGRASGL